MLTISNGLSFVRIPLAFLFLQENVYVRCLAVVLAMITDSIDGYLARRTRSVSTFGAILDPLTDKFFVYFALASLFLEGRILAWQAFMMLSRDIAIFLYGMFMLLMGRWRAIVIRALQAGKMTTAFQFIVLIGLVFHMTFSWVSYSMFVGMGAMAFVEQMRRSAPFAGQWNIFSCHEG